jgi:hypothetical protein
MVALEFRRIYSKTWACGDFFLSFLNSSSARIRALECYSVI